MVDTEIYWFTGQAGAGKTEIGNALKAKLQSTYTDHRQGKKVVMVDGDDIRSIYENSDYSIEGRKANVEFVQKLCRFLIKNEVIPIVCMVSPFADQRAKMKELYHCKEIYIHTTEIRGRENYHVDYFEKPIGKNITIDTTGKTVEESLEELWRNL